jgi:uncharacterized membrane protein YfcA
MLVAAGLGLLIGIALGALGGGGGVLTVPALVYVLGETAQDATTSSVVIVGITAAVGALARIRGGSVRWGTGLAFGAVGIPSAALGTVLNQHVAQPVLLLCFAALTVLAAIALVINSRSTPHHADADPPSDAAGELHPATPSSGPRTAIGVDAPPKVTPHSRIATVAKIVAGGLVIGFLTGFLGVGGGFLIVPALVIALRMPMTKAVGTSLLIIAITAAAALATRAGVAVFDWTVLVPFTVAAIAGSVAGKRIADHLSRATLTHAFAVMLLAVGASIAIHSLSTL